MLIKTGATGTDMKRTGNFVIACAINIFSGLLWGCVSEIPKEVVVYTSHDQIHSAPILNLFQTKTGIKVKAVYDVEAAKTAGIVNRLIAEKTHPRSDVFWNIALIRSHNPSAVPLGMAVPLSNLNNKDIAF
jgi:hypothetical protein